MHTIPVYAILFLLYCALTLTFYIWLLGQKGGAFAPEVVVANFLPLFIIPGPWEYYYFRWAKRNEKPYRKLLMLSRPALLLLMILTGIGGWQIVL
jgi:hypothetical protein